MKYKCPLCYLFEFLNFQLTYLQQVSNVFYNFCQFRVLLWVLYLYMNVSVGLEFWLRMGLHLNMCTLVTMQFLNILSFSVVSPFFPSFRILLLRLLVFDIERYFLLSIFGPSKIHFVLKYCYWLPDGFHLLIYCKSI